MLVFKQICLVIKREDRFYKVKHCNASKWILQNVINLLPHNKTPIILQFKSKYFIPSWSKFDPPFLLLTLLPSKETVKLTEHWELFSSLLSPKVNHTRCHRKNHSYLLKLGSVHEWIMPFPFICMNSSAYIWHLQTPENNFYVSGECN